MHGDMGAWAWGMMVVGPLMWLAIPALIAWAAWALAGRQREPAVPLELLKQSYARGQITREQFEQAKKDLA